MTRRVRPARVAIVGGGCASLSAAFELTRAEHQGNYQVTVFQAGWRLGGKGASGRGPADRIEEHGLHLWMGFYENAFRLMRDCYAELGRDPGRCHIATWQDAFSPAPDVAVADRLPGGGWQAWVAHFPPGPGLPGDDLGGRGPFTVSGYLARSVELLIELLRSTHRGPGRGDAEAGAARETATADREGLAGAAERLLRYGRLAGGAAILEAAALARAAIEQALPGIARAVPVPAVVLALLDALSEAARRQLAGAVEDDLEVRRVWQVADVILAILRGSFRFGLAADPRGFDAINDYDWRQWLKLNGASDSSLDSGFVRGIYDLVFAYQDGDTRRPSLAAGVALRGAMRMFFTYRGALFWKMNAGMGDIVFAPLYEVLRRRGVRFEFFHRLTDVQVRKDDGPGDHAHVSGLAFDVQAVTRHGQPYEPLVDVRGLPCWPARPDYRQLADGQRLEREGWSFEAFWDRRHVDTKRLAVGKDFDFVILGVGAAALPHVARQLIEHSPRWRAMVGKVKTVATQACQLWLSARRDQLGWPGPAISLSGYVEPFDTWADMSHLIPEETFPSPPRSIAYLCSVLGVPADVGLDQGSAAAAGEQVRRNAVAFLNRDAAALWPRAVDEGGAFRWELLVDPASPTSSTGSTGEARLQTQYWTANVNPSDRYVLSLPGTCQYRISPLDMSFDNLTVAGDWTASGLDSGCIESAVMSGRLAAHALSHSPPLADIVGYDHP